MNLSKIKYAYFLGIGGIGMSAIARYFHASGVQVSGYDKTSTSLTTELEKEGIPIRFTDDVSSIPTELLNKDNFDKILVVYTPAIPGDHPQLNYFKNENYPLMKRSRVLGLITENAFTVAVAGTHGKTTTSSMIAHLLHHAGINCTAFLGGIALNFNSNLLLGKPAAAKHIIVVEADEYDRSFLTLHPDISVITSMDADHLDIYGDKKYLEESYQLFAGQLKKEGKLFFRQGLTLNTTGMQAKSYGLTPGAQHAATSVRIQDHQYHFDYKDGTKEIRDLHSGLPGLHNVENAVAAIAVALSLGVGLESLKSGVSAYRGVKRRFELQARNSRYVYIDDYAHHPEELRACISSVRDLYPGKRILGVFQPHLFSRTRDFARGFAESLSLLDDLILLDIYPARELPIPGVSSGIIMEKVRIASAELCKMENVLEVLPKHDFDVLLTLGAGDIDQIVTPLRNWILNNN